MQETGIRVNVGVSGQQQIEQMSKSVGALTEKLQKATEAGNYRDVANLTVSLNNLKQAERQAAAIEKQKVTESQSKSNSIVRALSGGSSFVSTLAGGNYAGAATSLLSGTGGALSRIGSSMTAGGLGAAGGILGVLGLTALAGGAVMAGGNALAEKYEETLPYRVSMNRLFTGRGANPTQQEGYWYNLAVEEAKGTGLRTNDFISAATEAAKYGIKGATSQEQGENLLKETRRAALMAYGTGTDISSVSGYMGLERRYGGRSDIDAAYRGLIGTGLQKGQFGEFLQGLRRVMEDGIANGYMKSTEEITANLKMFADLSGNSPMWTGEQGINRLMTISSSISGATALSSVNDVIVASVANDAVKSLKKDNPDRFKELTGSEMTGTYVDTMLMLEKGLSPELFKGLGAAINSMEGGNYAARIERWRQTSGLNYKGAVELDNMYQKYQRGEVEDFDKALKAITDKPEYNSNEARMTTALNSFNQNLANIGEKMFNVKVMGFEKMSAVVQAIARTILPRESSKLAQDNFWNGKGESVYKRAFKQEFEKPGRSTRFEGFQDWITTLSPEEMKRIDDMNYLNFIVGTKEGYDNFMRTWQGIRDAGGVFEWENGMGTYLKQGLNLPKGYAKTMLTEGIGSVNNEEQDRFDSQMMNILGEGFGNSEERSLFLASDQAEELGKRYYYKFFASNPAVRASVSNEDLLALLREAIVAFKESRNITVKMLNGDMSP